eukprot:m.557714 g.557714  ORF g.557714 m.557714 type:complete len:991 (+) comp57760_c0_seq1:142-3114(+)
MALFQQFESDEPVTSTRGMIRNYSSYSHTVQATPQRFTLEQQPIFEPDQPLPTELVLDDALFPCERMDIVPPGGSISVLVVSRGLMIFASTNHRVYMVNLVARQEGIGEIALGPKVTDFNVKRLFLDPSAKHLLISASNLEGYAVFYVNFPSAEASQLKKLKGMEITAVAWNPTADPTTTKDILLGCSDGLVYETEIQKNTKFLNKVYRVSEPSEPILGLRTLAFSKLQDPRKHFLMISTPTRLFQFVGSTSAEGTSLFGPLLSSKQNLRLRELPGNLSYSELHLWSPSTRELARKFAWLAPPGVFLGEIDLHHLTSIREEGQQLETPMTSEFLFKYSTTTDRKHGPAIPNPPMSIAVTEFHVVLLYQDHYEVICTLNDKLVATHPFPTTVEYMAGLARDDAYSEIYAYAPRTIYKLNVDNESRDVWEIFLERKQFSQAKLYCKPNSPQLQTVLIAEGEDLLERLDFKAAAKILAQTDKSFEEVSLRFLKDSSNEGLKIYLFEKLQRLSSRDKIQLTLVATWVVELYLNELSDLKALGDPLRYQTLQGSFRSLLGMDRVLHNLNQQTTYELIASHGNMDDLIYFATLTKDYERVISHYISIKNYELALDVLASQKEPLLYYRFAPMLMPFVPRQCVTCFLEELKLDPRLLIPALVRYETSIQEHERPNEAIRYLEVCVYDLKNEDPAIHNYLLSLYAKLGDEERLMHFLGISTCFNRDYALRLCAQQRKLRACVKIYCLLGLMEEAVDLALKLDLNLAIELANMTSDEASLDLTADTRRKNLWLRIAKHVVEEEKNIKKAMEVVHECELLKIEDILPCFPDFEIIDEFQDALCTSLEEYERQITSLRRDMDHTTKSAGKIRTDLTELKNKTLVVSGVQACELCDFPLLDRQFYLFACKHGFHADCLTNEVARSSQAVVARRIEELRIAALSSQETVFDGNSLVAAASPKAQLDEIVAAECLACGDALIRSITRPFISQDKIDGERKTWDL